MEDVSKACEYIRRIAAIDHGSVRIGVADVLSAFSDVSVLIQVKSTIKAFIERSWKISPVANNRSRVARINHLCHCVRVADVLASTGYKDISIGFQH